MNKLEIINLASELNLPRDQYVIFGGGCLALREIREAEDLDVFTSASVYKALQDSGTWTERTYRSKNTHLIRNAGSIVVQAFCNWEADGWQPDFERYLDFPEIVANIPCMPLVDLYIWKTDIGRCKDIDDLAKIEEYWESNRI